MHLRLVVFSLLPFVFQLCFNFSLWCVCVCVCVSLGESLKLVKRESSCSQQNEYWDSKLLDMAYRAESTSFIYYKGHETSSLYHITITVLKSTKLTVKIMFMIQYNKRQVSCTSDLQLNTVTLINNGKKAVTQTM